MIYKLINLSYSKNWFIIKKKISYLLIINSKILIIQLRSNLKINNNTGNIKTIVNKNNSDSLTLKINFFLKSLNCFITKKIKFSGKGFKIKKTKNKLKFMFNKSHKIYNLSKHVMIRKISKTVIICLSKKNDSFSYSNILRIFKFNLFTKKGLKLVKAKQIVKKK